jgi:hypothetical protein
MRLVGAWTVEESAWGDRIVIGFFLKEKGGAVLANLEENSTGIVRCPVYSMDG